MEDEEIDEFINSNKVDNYEELRKKVIKKLKDRRKEALSCKLTFKPDSFYEQCMNETTFITPSSIKIYTYRMRFIKKYYAEENTTTHSILTKPWKYAIRIMDSDVNLKSKLNSFVAILSYLQYGDIKRTCRIFFTLWYAPFKLIHREMTKQIESHTATKKQEDSMIDWKEIIKKRDNLEYGSMDHIILSMHTYIPPRRQEDYCEMKVYTDENLEPEKNHNYFQLYNKRLGSPVLFYKDFKTSKFMPSFLNKEIPQKFVDIVKFSLEKHPRDYLIVNPSNDKYNPISFRWKINDTLKRVLGNKHASVNTLRHSYVNYISKKELTYGQRKRIAHKMGHGISTNMEYMLLAKDKKDK